MAFEDTRPVVHVVHCVDTEGPLHESLEATFGRLSGTFGLKLAPTLENLERVRRREFDLGGWEEAAARMVSPQQLDYLDTWDKLDTVLDELFNPGFRGRYRDSFGNPWVLGWFCMDHVGFETNPRRRALGHHVVFDHYRARLAAHPEAGDELAFHFHPVPMSRQANHRATSWFATDTAIFRILARRIIDRGWFPCAHRPGFNATRPDGHWFLEQHVPFDFANQAWTDPRGAADASQPDRATGRFVDWRRAPESWAPYHPHHDDYQRQGDCRRWIARCLNAGARARVLTQPEVDRAFAQAGAGEPVVLAFADHDHRSVLPDVAHVHAMLERAASARPDVAYRLCTPREAMRRALGLAADAVAFDLSWRGNVLRIEADQPTFGPQPFLALKTLGGQYHADNLDFEEPFRRWSYTFDAESLPLEAVEAVGLGAASPSGGVTVAVWRAGAGEWTQNHL
ncbi:MAG: hypothetical protein AB7D51_07825 [Desulfovibrionaceae bacterium]